MAKIQAKITGLRQLERNLLEISKEYGPKKALQTLRPAIRKALLPLEQQIRAKTPRDSGDLAKLTTIKVGKPSKRERGSSRVSSDAVLIGKVGWFWRGKPSFWFQALAVEFGTRFVPGRSVLRSAIESNQSTMLETFKRELKISIEKKVKQLSKGPKGSGR